MTVANSPSQPRTILLVLYALNFEFPYLFLKPKHKIHNYHETDLTNQKSRQLSLRQNIMRIDHHHRQTRWEGSETKHQQRRTEKNPLFCPKDRTPRTNTKYVYNPCGVGNPQLMGKYELKTTNQILFAQRGPYREHLLSLLLPWQ